MDVRTIVEQRLREYLARKDVDQDLRTVVAKFGALPLWLDMGGCVALRADGTLIEFAWDEPHDPKVVRGTRETNLALYQGSLKYPELTPLVPARPIDAPVCAQCNGTGEVVFLAPERAARVVCHCGGLGWLPPARVDA